jgi:hypothetical protein
MADAARGAGLHTIFTFFLGLMVTVFVGVGVYTFHPPNREPEQRVRELNRREQAIRNSKSSNDLTDADRQQIQQLTDQRNQINDAEQAGREAWGRSTSIIIIVLATLAMAVSLVRAEQLPVISNGLLMGGVFSMVYGVGWIVVTDTSFTRFVVMTIALIITLGLGYVRFVRSRAAPAAAGVGGAASHEGLAGVERRLRELEERMDGAASALGGKG